MQRVAGVLKSKARWYILAVLHGSCCAPADPAARAWRTACVLATLGLHVVNLCQVHTRPSLARARRTWQRKSPEPGQSHPGEMKARAVGACTHVANSSDGLTYSKLEL